MADTTLRQGQAGIKRRTLILAAPMALLARRTRAAAYPKIEVSRIWVRFTRDLESSAYFTLLNHTEETDQLTGVTSPLADKCTLQKVKWKGLDMSLVDLPQIPVPPMARIELNPKSVRVTIKFTHPMDRSTPVPLILAFAHAGHIEVNAEPTERQLGPPRGP